MNNYHNIFPNTTKTIASYNTVSQVIDLSSFDERDFQENLGKSPDNEKRINNLAIFSHEIAHWVDHISTLWGHTSLLLLYNALNARATNEINQFWRIKMYGDICKQDTLFDYFTEIYNPINGSIHQPWRVSPSAGFRFMANGATNPEKPILFVRFLTHNNVRVARVPISIVSILETIATKDEYKIKFQSLPLVEDIVERKRLEKVYQDELFNLIYNSKLTLYNVVSHLTANTAKASDVIWTLETASAIGTVVLNLATDEIKKMSFAMFGIEEIDNRVEAFKNSGDKGYVFYNLLLNLTTQKGEKTYELNDLLLSSGLSNDKDIEKEVISKMENNIKDLIPGPFYHRAKELLEFGVGIFKLRGIDGKKEGYKFSREIFTKMPHIMFGDTFFDEDKFKLEDAIHKLSGNEEISPAEEYFIFEHYQQKLDEFITICGI